MNKLKPIVSGLAMAGLLSAGISAQAAVIDDFSTDQTFLEDDTLADGGVSSSVVGPGIIGGERDLFVELLASPDPANSNVSFGVSANRLSYNSDPEVDSTGEVQWDGVDGSPNLAFGLGNIDLSAAGNAFKVDVIFSDADFFFDVGAWTDGTNEFSVIRLQAIATTTGASFTIPFTAFSNCAATNVTCGSGDTTPVDFSMLNAINLVVNPLGAGTASQRLAIDFTIDSITTVPEPATLALFGAGLLGIGAATRRQRKTAAAA